MRYALRPWAIKDMQARPLEYAMRTFTRSATPESITAIFDGAARRIADQVTLGHEIEESDDHIRGTLNLRRSAVLNLDVAVNAGDADDSRSVFAAKVARELIVETPWFAEMSDWLLRAVLLQWSGVELEWSIDTAGWTPIGYRHIEPQRWSFDLAGRPTLFSTLPAGSAIGDIPLTPGKHCWLSSGIVNTQPGSFSLLRAVAKLWFIGRLDMIELGKQVDRWAQPYIVFTVPETMSDDAVQLLIDSVVLHAGDRIAALKGGANAIVEPVPDRSPHLDVQDFVRRAISKLLLGQDSAQNAIEGQRTGATLQGNVRDDIRDGDSAALDAAINATLLAPWCAWNFGEDVAPPRIERSAPDDLGIVQRAAVYEAARRIGLPLVSRQVYADLRLEMPAETPEVIEPPAAPPSFFGGEPFDDEEGVTRATAGTSDPYDEAARVYASSFGAHRKLITDLAEEIAALMPLATDGEKLAEFRRRIPELLQRVDPSGAADLIHAATFATYGRAAIAQHDDIQRRRNKRGQSSDTP